MANTRRAARWIFPASFLIFTALKLDGFLPILWIWVFLLAAVAGFLAYVAAEVIARKVEERRFSRRVSKIAAEKSPAPQETWDNYMYWMTRR